jgi:hypothetical protein
MRMDIENSPDARSRTEAAARHDLGQAGRNRAAGDGGIGEKCLCCTNHPASWRGENARRLGKKRGGGVRWIHASFNLVDRSRLGAAKTHRQAPGMNCG